MATKDLKFKNVSMPLKIKLKLKEEKKRDDRHSKGSEKPISQVKQD